MLTMVFGRFSRLPVVLAVLALLAYLSAAAIPAAAQEPNELLKSVVQIKIRVPADARTAESLGTRREGSGVVIDASGLVVTIGYLIVESDQIELVTATGRTVPASFVGYDHDSGFGLVRADAPLGLAPLRFGDSSAVNVRDRVIVAAHGGADGAVPAMVV
jgi:S1-C subfamily serine protease